MSLVKGNKWSLTARPNLPLNPKALLLLLEMLDRLSVVHYVTYVDKGEGELNEGQRNTVVYRPLSLHPGNLHRPGTRISSGTMRPLSTII
jgi:hypothetical protein